jgi:hypothetical protein
MPLMMTLVAIYDDGSEALHGTLYGCTFHLGMYQPGQGLECAADMCEHHHRQMTMAFFLFTLLLGGIVEFLSRKVYLEDLAPIAQNVNNQLLDILKRCDPGSNKPVPADR